MKYIVTSMQYYQMLICLFGIFIEILDKIMYGTGLETSIVFKSHVICAAYYARYAEICLLHKMELFLTYITKTAIFFCEIHTIRYLLS